MINCLGRGFLTSLLRICCFMERIGNVSNPIQKWNENLHSLCLFYMQSHVDSGTFFQKYLCLFLFQSRFYDISLQSCADFGRTLQRWGRHHQTLLWHKGLSGLFALLTLYTVISKSIMQVILFQKEFTIVEIFISLDL